MPSSEIRPFLKWVGGKTKLLPQLLPLLPKRINTYYEPFLGGAAVFFHLASTGLINRAVLNDFNPELINCYRVVRDFPEELIEQTARLKFDPGVFKELRAIRPSALSPVRRAARTIYLNRTGFNGLYRLNKKGEFNVPWGKYVNPTILDAPRIRACGEALNRYASLYSEDFSSVVEAAVAGDVVYFDPPYVPLNATSNFRSYTKEGFGLQDQKRLALCFRQLVERGVAVLASNSDTPLVRELYSDFETHVVHMRRNINSKGEGRGPINELLLVGRLN